MARQAAADTLSAAVYDVREKLGPSLFQASSIEEFRDRIAMMKHDQSLHKIIAAHLPPVTGVVRRIAGRNSVLENEFKQILAASQRRAADGGMPHDFVTPSDIPGGEFNPHQSMEGLYPHGPHGPGNSSMTGSRRRAEFDNGTVDIKSTYSPSEGKLEPTDDFEGYKDSVDQGADAKVERNFQAYRIWCAANGLSPLRISSLDRYALNLSDAQYMLLAGKMQEWEHNHQPRTPKGQGEDKLKDVTARRRRAIKWSDGTNDKGELVGSGWPQLEPADWWDDEGKHHYDPKRNEEAKSRRVDGKGMHFDGGRRESRRRHALDATPTPGPGNSEPNTIKSAPGNGVTNGGPMDPGNANKIETQWGGQGIEARRRDPMRAYAAWCARNSLKRLSARNVARYAANDPELAIYLATRMKQAIREARRRQAAGWSPEDNRNLDENEMCDECGAHIPFNEEIVNNRHSDHCSLNPSSTHHPRSHEARRRTAAPDYLQKADDALTQLLQQKAEEFQETIAPLQQALQTVQQATQLQQQQQGGLNVLPPGSVNVLPGGQPGTAAQMGMPDPNAPDTSGLAQMLAQGGGDPAAQQGAPPPAPMGGSDNGGPPPAAAAAGGLPPELQQQQMMARRGYPTRPRQANNVFDLWNEYQNKNTVRGNDADYESFAQQYKVGPRAIQKLKTQKAPYANGTAGVPRSASGSRRPLGSGLRQAPQQIQTRRTAKGYGRKCPECRSNNTDYSHAANDYDCYDCGVTFKPYSNPKKNPEKKSSHLRQAKSCTCWEGYKRVPGTKPCAKGSCEKCDTHRKESSLRRADLRNDLMQAEGDEIKTLGEYDDFRDEAERAGDDQAVDAFDEVLDDERDHARIFGDEIKHLGHRKTAWMGWGPAVFPKARKVAGWDWDTGLDGYTATKPHRFACECGDDFPTPTGFRVCGGCGRQWNSYVIGTGGNNREAAVEKFLVREIPVRPDVIVANRRLASLALMDRAGNLHKLVDAGELDEGEDPGHATFKKQPKDWAQRGKGGQWSTRKLPV